MNYYDCFEYMKGIPYLKFKDNVGLTFIHSRKGTLNKTDDWSLLRLDSFVWWVRYRYMYGQDVGISRLADRDWDNFITDKDVIEIRESNFHIKFCNCCQLPKCLKLL